MSNKYVNHIKYGIHVGNPTGKSVLLMVADCAGDDGICKTSDKRISQHLELGYSTTRKWLLRLEDEFGLIKKRRIRGDNGKLQTVLELTFNPSQARLRLVSGEGLEMLPQSKKVLPQSRNNDEDLLPQSTNLLPQRNAPTEHHSTSRDLFISEHPSVDQLIDACVREHDTVDRRLVAIAVIETMIRRLSSPGQLRPIGSLRYFDEEILVMAADGARLSSDARDALVRRRREQLDAKLLSPAAAQHPAAVNH